MFKYCNAKVGEIEEDIKTFTVTQLTLKYDTAFA